jgi:hypothetical protein
MYQIVHIFLVAILIHRLWKVLYVQTPIYFVHWQRTII